MWEQLLQWDKEILLYFNNLGSETYDQFWILVTQIKTWIPLYLFFFFLFLKTFPFKKALIAILFSIISVSVSLGLTEMVKMIFDRVRPCNNEQLQASLRILQTPDDYSFFSGHAAVSLTVTLFVILVLRQRYKWIWLSVVWPFLFCWSRIYVGVHYPSDILTGIIVGGILGYSLFKLYTMQDRMYQ